MGTSMHLPFMHTTHSSIFTLLVVTKVRTIVTCVVNNHNYMCCQQSQCTNVQHVGCAVCKGIYKGMGVSDSVYVVVFSGHLEALFVFKLLPFSILLARLYPSGCEGSVKAFLMSAMVLAMIVSGYLWIALAELIGVSGGVFSGLSLGIPIQALCTLIPLFLVSWIPDEDKRVEKKEE